MLSKKIGFKKKVHKLRKQNSLRVKRQIHNLNNVGSTPTFAKTTKIISQQPNLIQILEDFHDQPTVRKNRYRKNTA